MISAGQIKKNAGNVLVFDLCTDICVKEFVLTLLPASIDGMFHDLKEVIADDKGFSTHDLTRSVAEGIVLPSGASHPKNTTHHMGFYFMALSASQLVNCVKA